MTNRIHITVRTVDDLPFQAAGQKVYWDDELGGFGVVVGTKTKTFICQHDIDGTSKRRKLGRAGDVKAGFLNATMARERAKGFRQQMVKGEDPRPKSVKLRDALDRYLVAISAPGTERQAAPRTIALYRDEMERFLGDWLDRDLHKITREMVAERHKQIPRAVAEGLAKRVEDRIAAGLAKATQKRRVERLETAAADKRRRVQERGQTAGRSSANRVMKTLSAVYNFARALVGSDKMPPSPTEVLSDQRMWFEEPGRKKPIGGDTLKDKGAGLREWGAMVMALPNEVQRDWLLFALLSGMRKSTVSEMRWEHVDFDDRVLHIPHPKGGSRAAYDIPLSAALMGILSRRQKGNAAFEEEKCRPWVFPSLASKGGHLVDPRVKGKRAGGLPHWRIHDTKSTFINAARRASVPRHYYRKLSSHKWTKGDDVTEQNYEDITAEEMRPFQETISARLMAMIDPKGGDVVKLTARRRGA